MALNDLFREMRRCFGANFGFNALDLMPASRGLAYAVERAADPLDRAGIDTKALRYLSNSFGAPRHL
jgi:hypothetical protein